MGQVLRLVLVRLERIRIWLERFRDGRPPGHDGGEGRGGWCRQGRSLSLSRKRSLSQSRLR